MKKSDLSFYELQLLREARHDYVDLHRDDRAKIQKRLVNLGLLFMVGETRVGITDIGIEVLDG